MTPGTAAGRPAEAVPGNPAPHNEHGRKSDLPAEGTPPLASASNENVWLPQRREGGCERIRLFCFPHAGGGTALFHRWATEMPEGVELLPVRLPGREVRFKEPAYTDLMALVDALGEALLPELDKPYALLGHSLGALVGFELARLLRRRGEKLPEHLFVAACPAPQAAHSRSPIHHLPDDEFVESLRRRYNGIPSLATHEELIRLMLPTMRADVEAAETYRYRREPPLQCPILVLGGSEDRCVSPAHLAAWQKQTTREFSLRVFPGGHFFLHKAGRSVVRSIVGRLEPFWKGSPGAH